MSDPTPQDTAPGSGPLAKNWSANVPEGKLRKPFEVELYFDDRPNCYFRRDDRGNFIRANSQSAKRFLRHKGFSTKCKEGEISEADRVLEYVETSQNCDYAAPLAGHKPGLMISRGKRILVTSGPNLIDPKPGPWDTIREIFDGLLGKEQCRWFYAWLKISVEAVRNSRHRKGQALIIAGPANCGKSLCQEIITELLGGRIEKPFSALCEQTQFNAELFAAEHLMIEDESASSDPRVRKKFGAKIKGLVANAEQRCHAKNREALALRPIWRLTITLNDDPASLLVLPQWEDGLKDKLMLFHARVFKMPVDTTTDAGQGRLWRLILSELPAFVHFLDSFTIPQEMTDTRFGVKAFHNEELLDLMDAMTDEMKLMEMIDSVLFDVPQSAPWEGLARELEDKLRDVPGFRYLITSANTCGSLLGGLARKKDRVVKLPKLHGFQRWQIRPPSTD